MWFPSGEATTSSLVGMISDSFSTWEMIPTRPWLFRIPFRMPRASLMHSESREPKPSSMNMASSLVPPLWACTTVDRPMARLRARRNFSPPDRVVTLRFSPLPESSTSSSRPALWALPEDS